MDLEIQANIALYERKLSLAAELFQRSASAYLNEGYSLASAQCYRKAGELLVKLNRPKEALKSFIKAYRVYRDVSPILAIGALLSAANSLSSYKNYRLKLLKLTVGFLRKIPGSENQLIDTLLKLARDSTDGSRRRFLRQTIPLLVRSIKRTGDRNYKLVLLRKLLEIYETLYPVRVKIVRKAYNRLLRMHLHTIRTQLEYLKGSISELNTESGSSCRLRGKPLHIDELQNSLLISCAYLILAKENEILKSLLDELLSVKISFALELYKTTRSYLDSDERRDLLTLCEIYTFRRIIHAKVSDIHRIILIERLARFWAELDTKRALELFKVTGKMYKYMRDIYSLTCVLIEAGDTLKRAGSSQALKYYAQAYKYAEDIGDPQLINRVAHRIYRYIRRTS